ncbi:MAG: bifunctional folylpolyglutamate synthase/dihydrofolate synthase [Solobacterium sp.]|nr:bifunctional folylpolyglutamate synthase/dihydrofolate synthase [Solobacterium sp.]
MSEQIEWVMQRKNRYHGLSPLKKACEKIGNPQNDLKIVHIAGTNGKGSTTNYLKDILIANGYKTGTFTSPHLIDHRDRIRINDAWIPEEKFLYYLNRFMDLILEYDLGMFEIDELICFAWMKEEKVDYLLLETGLGGRLDNTNIIEHPVLEIITTIGFDHMNVLGNRLSQIAFEKAGIIKPYSRCAIGFLNEKAIPVIQKNAWRKHASVIPVNTYRPLSANMFVWQKESYKIQGASYQKRNACLALHAAWLLGMDVKTEKIKEAVYTSKWLGRFEKVHEHPLVILDGAHNEEGVLALIESMKNLPRPLTVLFSALKDKPAKKMAILLEKNCDHLIVTHFENQRSGDEKDFAVKNAKIIHDWQKAVNECLEQSQENVTIVITGSLYFISLVRALFENIN